LAILTFYHANLGFPSKTGFEQHGFGLKIVKFDGFKVLDFGQISFDLPESFQAW
jgi:hypothetical protein